MFKVITRFAPSPTGYIHLGNIRTALFCWLFARKHNGHFFLRIDDTDKNRYSKKYVNNIFDSLKWLGIKYDGIPTFQSERVLRYKFFLDHLIADGKAYKCYCSKERLDSLKEAQMLSKSKIMYDGFCRHRYVSGDDNFVIRFMVDSNGYTEFNDLIRGKIKIPNNELDDFIISKDKYNVTYNFASCIDDIDFDITHIIRGEDHISNTQKQIILIKSFDSPIPNFAHLPMILDSEKKKLSKRDNSIYIDYYKKQGFLPMSVLNYIVRLGWGYRDKEIFSLSEMIEFFDIKDVSKSSSCINIDKLLWLNRHYIQKMSFKDLYYFSIPVFKMFNYNYAYGPSIIKLIEFNRSKFYTLYDIFSKSSYFYFVNVDETNVFKLDLDSLKLVLKFYYDLKKSFYLWNILNIKFHVEYFLKENGIIFLDFAVSLRVIITGVNLSTSLYELIFLSGKILILKKIINTIRRVGL
ncbi:MAG TPA: glutamate--tRNA ligase [Candidatus Azoamicus sp.]